MSDLLNDIKSARAELRRTEEETSEAGLRLRTCRIVERKARTELDALLDALENGHDSRYPLLKEESEPPPEPTAADRQPVREAPLEFASSRRKRKERSAS